MLYCLSPDCPKPQNPDVNLHCQHCGALLSLRNRFKALRPLGKGGFGTTYLAQDLDNRAKYCVIKRFSYQNSSTQATNKAKQLFEQEAERLDHLNHPQIPRLLAYFREGNHLYLVQEFIEGQTLHAELTQNGPFDEAKIRGVLEGLLPILQFVHGRNVIHRDIKPDNIMRRKTGELVLIDFGVAKLLEQSALAKTATTIGTIGFAAPEQTFGRVTPASDLFALGATCFALLTQAFSSGNTEMLGYRWVDRWQQYVKSPLRTDLTAVLTKMIDIDERSRYSNAAEVLKDLHQNQLGLGHEFSPASSAGSSARSSSSSSASGSTPLSSSAVSPSVVSPSAYSSPTVIAPMTALSAPPESPQTLVSPEAPPGTIQKVPVSPSFWFKYGLLSYIGQALSFALSMVGVAFYAVAFQPSLQDDINTVLSFIKLMYWVVGGVVIGTVQWIALRRWLTKALGWIPAVVGGYWAIACSRVIADDLSLHASLMMGLFIGGLQWLALRHQTPRAGWWILWASLMTTILYKVLATYSYSNYLVWGAIIPLLDGGFLTWVLRRQHTEKTVST